MKIIKKCFRSGLIALAAAFAFGLAVPATTLAAPASRSCDTHVFTFPTWYNGVVDDDCNIVIKKINQFWVIVMNFIEILLQLVAYVSAGFIIWGGFKYIKSEGDPSKISEAKAAIMNAVIGLVIALASVAIVQFVQGRIV